jgi:hypothetical protein
MAEPRSNERTGPKAGPLLSGVAPDGVGHRSGAQTGCAAAASGCAASRAGKKRVKAQ